MNSIKKSNHERFLIEYMKNAKLRMKNVIVILFETFLDSISCIVEYIPKSKMNEYNTQNSVIIIKHA